MTSRDATTSISEDHPGAETHRPNRRERRLARRQRNRRAAGLVGALVLGVSATAAGLSVNPTRAPQVAAAAETRNIGGLELAAARRSVLARPVEGVLLTHAAKVTDQARVAAAVEAARAAALTPKTGVNWDGIASCETGGNWSMQGSRFSGGLGFANTTWSGFGGHEFASNAGQASREQQIVVAERVYARYGLSGWGCKAHG
jgi:hypothetical protein